MVTKRGTSSFRATHNEGLVRQKFRDDVDLGYRGMFREMEERRKTGIF